MGAWKTWTPTYTGFSTPPSSVTARYTQIGKMVIAFVTSENGTSNSTSSSITLPVPARTGAKQRFHVRSTNNGMILSDPGMLATNSGSTTADLFTTLPGGSWKASAQKKVEFTITYETN